VTQEYGKQADHSGPEKHINRCNESKEFCRKWMSEQNSVSVLTQSDA
jgi:hypothetical protein